jgi:hypothetical protein
MGDTEIAVTLGFRPWLAWLLRRYGYTVTVTADGQRMQRTWWNDDYDTFVFEYKGLEGYKERE